MSGSRRSPKSWCILPRPPARSKGAISRSSRSKMERVGDVVADHLEPGHLGFGKFRVRAGVVGHDPVLEILADGVVEGGELRVEAAGATDERDERGELVDRLLALVVFEMAIGLPDARGRDARGVGAEFGQDLFE